MVGDTVKTISSELFTTMPTSSGLIFTYTSTLDDGSSLPSFISGILTLTSYQFTVYSSSASTAGTYQIKLTVQVGGTGQTTQLSTSFTLVVTAPPPNIVIT